MPSEVRTSSKSADIWAIEMSEYFAIAFKSSYTDGAKAGTTLIDLYDAEEVGIKEAGIYIVIISHALTRATVRNRASGRIVDQPYQSEIPSPTSSRPASARSIGILGI